MKIFPASVSKSFCSSWVGEGGLGPLWELEQVLVTNGLWGAGEERSEGKRTETDAAEDAGS